MNIHTPGPGLPLPSRPKRNPGDHRDEHNLLDAELSKEERNEEYAEGLGNLGEGNEHHGVLDAEGVLIDLLLAETLYVAVGEGVGNLQAHAQEHRENEEYGHFLLLEETEGLQAEFLDEALFTRYRLYRALRHREGEDGKYHAESGGEPELYVALGEAQQVHGPHGGDEAYGAPHPQRREVLDRVEPDGVEGVVAHRVVERDGRHKEQHGAEHHRIYGCIAGHERCADQEGGGQEVAEPEYFLGLHPPVCDYAHKRRHKNGGNALKGVETAYLYWGEAELAAQIGTEGNEPRSPCAEFQKVQNSDLDTNRCCLHHWSFVVSSCRLWDAATGKDTRIHATFTIFGV